MQIFHSDFRFVILTMTQGFYRGFTRPVAFGAVMIITLLIAWIILWPTASAEMLNAAKTTALSIFRGWFLYCLGAFVAFSAVVAATPIAGKLRLGSDEDQPSFSTGSWLSMMFCCGIGGGIVIYAVAEPMSHFMINPDVLQGSVIVGTETAARSAVKYTFVHWGLSAWACYAVLGLALALFSFRYNLPLTLRTAVAPLVGSRLSGPLGHAIDIFAIVAIVAGIATTLGYGVRTLVAGLNYLAGGGLISGGQDNLPALLLALGLCAVIAAASVISGVARGLKWLSNAGTVTFFIVGIYFALHADFDFLIRIGLGAFVDYVTQFPTLTLTVFEATDTEIARSISTWQTDWTIFYWTWWLAFAPFVGLFIARISRGRTVRQFILGSTIAPCGVCFAWFACTGAASLGLELGGTVSLASGLSASEQLYATIAFLNAGAIGQIFAWLSLGLMLVLAATTLASGILAINTIAAAGDAAPKPPAHILIWTLVSSVIIGALLAAGGTASIRDVMMISALPISGITVLAVVSLVLVLIQEARSRKLLGAPHHLEELERDETVRETIET